MDHSMLGVVAELMKKAIDPSGSLFRAIGVIQLESQRTFSSFTSRP